MNSLANLRRLAILTVLTLLFGFSAREQARAQALTLTINSAATFFNSAVSPHTTLDTFPVTFTIGGTATSATVTTGAHINVNYYDSSGTLLLYTQTAFSYVVLSNLYSLPYSGGRGTGIDATNGWNLAKASYTKGMHPAYAIYWYSVDITADDGLGHMVSTTVDLGSLGQTQYVPIP